MYLVGSFEELGEESEEGMSAGFIPDSASILVASDF